MYGGTSRHSKVDCNFVNVKFIEDPTQKVLFIFQDDDATTNYVQGTIAPSAQQGKPKFAPKIHNPSKFVGLATKSTNLTKPVSGNCYNCGESGHFSPDCLQPWKPIGYVLFCSNYKEPDHKYPECSQPQKPRPKYQYVATLVAVADSKGKASADVVVLRIDVIEDRLMKTIDQSWLSNVEKLFKVTTRSKSSTKPDSNVSSKKRRNSSKKKSSNKSITKEDLKDNPDYDRDAAKLFLKDISAEATKIINFELQAATVEKL
ncbi:hypothetical protein O6H91_06G044500 [Diphasiastrum complanatum]|uniref:Uncharacterized protein n=1 Tax=Diphasiastrum complanatum TaxID=34168 RepID=A0ACC2DDD0_DIPCM|nr:hypothetical protein O6H91_06G044500 [Diphasiastrum complanatum]